MTTYIEKSGSVFKCESFERLLLGEKGRSLYGYTNKRFKIKNHFFIKSPD